MRHPTPLVPLWVAEPGAKHQRHALWPEDHGEPSNGRRRKQAPGVGSQKFAALVHGSGLQLPSDVKPTTPERRHR